MNQFLKQVDMWNIFNRVYKRYSKKQDAHFTAALTSIFELPGLLNRLGLTEAEFSQKYISPFQGLDQHTLSVIAKCLTLKIRTDMGEEVIFKTLSPEYHRALDWMVARLYSFGLIGDLFGIIDREPESGGVILGDRHKRAELALPYLQCINCGKVDGYGTKEFKPKIRQDIWYCHAEGCPTTSGNASAHSDGCCWKIWTQYREKWRTKMRRASTPNKKAVVFRDLLKDLVEGSPKIRKVSENVHPTPSLKMTEDVRSQLRYSIDAKIASSVNIPITGSSRHPKVDPYRLKADTEFKNYCDRNHINAVGTFPPLRRPGNSYLYTVGSQDFLVSIGDADQVNVGVIENVEDSPDSGASGT